MRNYPKMKLALLAFLLFTLSHMTAFAGIINQKSKWKKSKINVCWIIPGVKYKTHSGLRSYSQRDQGDARNFVNFNQYKAVIETIVRQEYTLEKTGVEFVGWKNCPSTVSEKIYDAILFISANLNEYENFGGGSSVGDIRTISNEYYSQVTFAISVGKRWNRNINLKWDHVKRNALHEFGHLAGLVHEDYANERLHMLRDGDTIVNGYNPFSVMSYNFRDVINNYGLNFEVKSLEKSRDFFINYIRHAPPSFNLSSSGHIRIENILSTGDIEALRCLYIYKRLEFQQRCKLND
jgi:hypothetical protein